MTAMGGGRVLVVEDDEASGTFITRVLGRAGFEAVWAIDAEQAVRLLGQRRYDVLLTDVRLPGHHGIDLVTLARQKMPHLVIAVMTSYVEKELERAARASGADDFLEKPMSPAVLADRLHALVERSRQQALAAESSIGAGPAAPGPPAESGPVGAGGAAPSPLSPVTPDEALDRPAAAGLSAPGATPTALYPADSTSMRALSVSCWATAAPGVSRVASRTGAVTTGRTSAATAPLA